MLDDSAEGEPDRGFIQLHRKLLDQPFNRCPIKSSVWQHLLLNAAHKPHRSLLGGKEVVLQAGQLITGRKKILRECFDQKSVVVTEDMVRGALEYFRRDGMLTAVSSRAGSVYSIVNWDRYQGQLIKKRPQAIPKAAPQAIPQAIPQAEAAPAVGCSDVSPKQSPKEFPKGTPKAIPTIQEDNNKPLKDKKTCRADESAKEILTYLNNKTGKKFKPVRSHLDLINARLKDQFTADELRTIVDNMTAKWGNDSKMAEYLRPATLFQAGKADGYLNAMPLQANTFATTDYMAGTEGFDHV
ncbi:MAG: conserved phage C-terminal domain-containing protein [Motiliproteus sp.]